MTFMIIGPILKLGETLDWRWHENWKLKIIWTKPNPDLKINGIKTKLTNGPPKKSCSKNNHTLPDGAINDDDVRVDDGYVCYNEDTEGSVPVNDPPKQCLG
jgi:hypothetical protein